MCFLEIFPDALYIKLKHTNNKKHTFETANPQPCFEIKTVKFTI